MRIDAYNQVAQLYGIQKSGKTHLTAAGAAHHQHIFVPGVLGVRWTIAHH